MQILFQILFIIFAIFAINSIWSRKKDQLLTTRGTWFWTLFWVVAIIAVAWPESTAMIANLFGIGRGTDVVLYISVVTLFFLLFRLHIKLETINRNITEWVRKEALKKEDKRDEK